jgi:hypothetical protein
MFGVLPNLRPAGFEPRDPPADAEKIQGPARLASSGVQTQDPPADDEQITGSCQTCVQRILPNLRPAGFKPRDPPAGAEQIQGPARLAPSGVRTQGLTS